MNCCPSCTPCREKAAACNLFDLQGTEFRDNLEHKLGVLRAVAAILPEVHAIEPKRG